MALTRRGQLGHAMGYLTTFAVDKSEPLRFDAMRLLAFELNEAGEAEHGNRLLQQLGSEMQAAGIDGTMDLTQPPSTLPPGPMSPGGSGYSPNP
jgi:hypothetical protein